LTSSCCPLPQQQQIRQLTRKTVKVPTASAAIVGVKTVRKRKKKLIAIGKKKNVFFGREQGPLALPSAATSMKLFNITDTPVKMSLIIDYLFPNVLSLFC
jgi:hypothetical protein